MGVRLDDRRGRRPRSNAKDEVFLALVCLVLVVVVMVATWLWMLAQ